MVIAGLATLVSLPIVAQADTYVYNDPDFDFTVSFPDTWREQSPDTPTTRLRVFLSEEGPLAGCRVKAEKDGRLLVYPERYMKDAVELVLGEKFWDNELNEYQEVDVIKTSKPAGLGQGHAVMKHAVYKENGIRKQGFFLGSIYGDIRYVMSCSAKASEFPKYAELFGSVMGSMRLKQKYHPVETGFYRDFLSDKD